MILDNCTALTIDGQRRIREDGAVAVLGNAIAGVGKSEALRAQFPDEPIRDLHGWVVMPGLVDWHVYPPQALLRGCGDEVPFSV